MTEEKQKLFADFRKWQPSQRVFPKGVIVAADIQQEWLLPWWWANYSRFNSLPVAFVDFGMSKENKEWCKERGIWVPLLVPDVFVAERGQMEPLFAKWLEEKMFGTSIWEYRNAWFKKPMACLKSPFETAVWMDLDCEVRGSLDILFEAYGSSIAMTRHPEKNIPYPIYNSGVIVFKRGLAVLEEWADISIEQNHLFGGDQEILSKLFLNTNMPLELPAIYNWSRMWPDNPDAIIQHWHGPHGKNYIRHQIMSSNLQSLDFLN